MKVRCFDFEVFPHWWLCVFGDMPNEPITNDIKNTFKIVHSDMPNARDALVSLLKEEGVCVCGYNIKHYDLIIANAIYQGLKPEEVKIINDIVINPSMAYCTKEHLRLSSMAKRKFSTIYEDFMDDNSGSLKELEANLGLNILESSVDFNKEDLTQEDKDEVILYCKQDVYATMKYFEKIVVYYCRNKELICKTFGIKENLAYTSTNATLVGMVLGASKTSFGDEEKVEITLPVKIKEYCYENLPHNILERILNNTKSFDVQLFGNTVTFGNGGIHSVINGYDSDNEALYVESDDEYALINVDAASYYPSIMIQFNLLSRAIKDKSHFKNIFDTRYIRVFSFYAPNGKDIADMKSEVLYYLEKFVVLAREYGITLCHENEAKIYGDTPNRCKELLDHFSGELKCVFDMGNFVLDGAEPYTAYELLKEDIA